MAAGAKAYEFESEADYLGLYMLARGGFDITAAPDLWRRRGVQRPDGQIKNYFSSHPSTPERAVAMTETIAEIREKQSTQMALLPSTLPGETLAVTAPDGSHSQPLVLAAQPPAHSVVGQAVVPTQSAAVAPLTAIPQTATVLPASVRPARGRKMFAQLYLIRGPIVSNPPQTFNAEFLENGEASVVLSGRRRLTGRFELFGPGEAISAKYTARLIDPETVKSAAGADARGFALFGDGSETDLECVYSLVRSTGRGQGMCADNQRNTYRIVFD